MSGETPAHGQPLHGRLRPGPAAMSSRLKPGTVSSAAGGWPPCGTGFQAVAESTGVRWGGGGGAVGGGGGGGAGGGGGGGGGGPGGGGAGRPGGGGGRRTGRVG